MLKLAAPWTMEIVDDRFINIVDQESVFLVYGLYPHDREKRIHQCALMTNSPELYEAAKEMIDLKNKLWYYGLDEIEQGVFNSVLAKFEIAIDKIEKEAAHDARNSD